MEANENVSMKSSGNRVVDALVFWSAEEARMRQSFSNPKYLAKEKYAFFEGVLREYGDTKNPNEKRYLNMIKGEMKDILKVAVPNKLVRFIHKTDAFVYNSMKAAYDTVKTIYDAAKWIVKEGKRVADTVREGHERRKAERVQQTLLKDKARQETIKRYDDAIRPLFDKGKENTVGPDPRRNNIETDRGEEQKVRYSFDNDAPLISKKTSKTQSVSGTDESLLQKNREGTGKGMRI